MLFDEKDTLNDQNKYSHNFFDKYCYCNKNYTEDQAMYQCTFCEDWFHSYHLNPDATKLLEDLDKEEKDWFVMCRNCAVKNSNWVSKYPETILNYEDIQKFEHETNDKQDKATPKEDSRTESNPEVGEVTRKRPYELIENDNDEKKDENEHKTKKAKPMDENPEILKDKEISLSKPKKCKLLTRSAKSLNGYDLILSNGFAEALCSCEDEKCVELKKKMESHVKKVATYSQETELFDRDLMLDYLKCQQEGGLLHTDETGTNNDSTQNKDKADPSGLFTEEVNRSYPNVTPHQKLEIVSGLEQAIVGLFKYHSEKRTNEDDKVITKETVIEYLDKLNDKGFPSNKENNK